MSIKFIHRFLKCLLIQWRREFGANLSDDSNSALQFINFVAEGRGSGSYGISLKRRNILTAANDLEITADLSGGGTFTVEVAITNLKSDVVI